MQTFIENIDPFPDTDEKEVTDYLWTKSIEIEPKNANPNQKKKLSVSCFLLEVSGRRKIIVKPNSRTARLGGRV